MASTHSKHITPSMRKTCEGCGTAGQPTSKWLCKGCHALSRRARQQRYNRERSGRQHLPPVIVSRKPSEIPNCVCKSCDAVFKPKASDRTTFCSRECSWDWQKARAAVRLEARPVVVTTYHNRCTSCSARYSIGKAGTSLCEACRGDAGRYYAPITEGQCGHCGAVFDRDTDGATMYMCSAECKGKAAAKAKRSARKKRKALERGARKAETVDPFEVFKRDGWKCQNCRRKTPRIKRGTYDSNAPELDHIMPLSLGGEHTYRNTQLLCRACNAVKSNSPMGQLSLL